MKRLDSDRAEIRGHSGVSFNGPGERSKLGPGGCCVIEKKLVFGGQGKRLEKEI